MGDRGVEMCYVIHAGISLRSLSSKARATAWPQKPSPVVSEVRTGFGVDTWQLPWTTSRELVGVGKAAEVCEDTFLCPVFLESLRSYVS